jgi:hypothetical protein
VGPCRRKGVENYDWLFRQTIVTTNQLHPSVDKPSRTP